MATSHSSLSILVFTSWKVVVATPTSSKKLLHLCLFLFHSLRWKARATTTERLSLVASSSLEGGKEGEGMLFHRGQAGYPYTTQKGYNYPFTGRVHECVCLWVCEWKYEPLLWKSWWSDDRGWGGGEEIGSNTTAREERERWLSAMVLSPRDKVVVGRFR